MDVLEDVKMWQGAPPTMTEFCEDSLLKVEPRIKSLPPPKVPLAAKLELAFKRGVTS
jgi:hypothetical protein